MTRVRHDTSSSHQFSQMSQQKILCDWEKDLKRVLTSLVILPPISNPNYLIALIFMPSSEKSIWIKMPTRLCLKSLCPEQSGDMCRSCDYDSTYFLYTKEIVMFLAKYLWVYMWLNPGRTQFKWLPPTVTIINVMLHPVRILIEVCDLTKNRSPLNKVKFPLYQTQTG